MAIHPETYKKIVAAKLYMDENFHEPINLQAISRRACLSRYHFHRLFTHIYRRTPHQYLTQRRIGQARELLAGNDFSVVEICNNVGFASIGSFNVLFKKEIGQAPRSYRKLAWTKAEEIRASPGSFIPNCFIDAYRLDQ